MKANTIPTERLMAVEAIPRGEFVKRVKLCEVCQGTRKTRQFDILKLISEVTCTFCDGRGYHPNATVFVRGEYDKVTKRYALEDTLDMNREVFVRKGILLHVGFTY